MLQNKEGATVAADVSQIDLKQLTKLSAIICSSVTKWSLSPFTCMKLTRLLMYENMKWAITFTMTKSVPLFIHVIFQTSDQELGKFIILKLILQKEDNKV
jgi:hypothetical protein